MGKGKIIVLDGVDGCGKTTQFELLQRILPMPEYVFVSFPIYASETGMLIREYLKGELKLTDEQRDKLYAADRYLNYLSDWKSAYEAGKTIIAARYTCSMQIYSAARQDKSQWSNVFYHIGDYEYHTLGLPTPDKVIFLDVDNETYMNNLAKRYDTSGGSLDIHEADVQYMLNCRAVANYFCDNNYGGYWSKVICCQNNEMRSIDDIHNEILAIINS